MVGTGGGGTPGSFILLITSSPSGVKVTIPVDASAVAGAGTSEDIDGAADVPEDVPLIADTPDVPLIADTLDSLLCVINRGELLADIKPASPINAAVPPLPSHFPFNPLAIPVTIDSII